MTKIASADGDRGARSEALGIVAQHFDADLAALAKRTMDDADEDGSGGGLGGLRHSLVFRAGEGWRPRRNGG